MPLSLAVANGLVQHLCGQAAYTAPSSPVYLALITGTLPTQSTSMATLQGQEPTFGGSYARVAVTPSTDVVAAFQSGGFVLLQTAVAITFPTITTGGEVITGVALVENSSGTGGRWFTANAFSGAATYTLVTGNKFNIASGQNICRYVPSATVGISTYAMCKLIDLMTGKTAYTSPTPYFAICSSIDALTSTATEVAYAGYGRTSLAGVFGAASLGVCKNTALFDCAATNTSGSTAAFADWALMDAASSGNMLCGSTLITSPLAIAGTPRVSATALSVSVG